MSEEEAGIRRSLVGDFEPIVDYFHGAGEVALRAMGVDPARLPARQDWLATMLAQHRASDRETERGYVTWLHHGAPVGHSSLSHIAYGDRANIHLHLWRAPLRARGLGTIWFRLSAAYFAEQFALKTIVCEPYADNPAPNRVLTKLGFTFVRRYRTIPGPLNFEQDVNRWELPAASLARGA